MNDHDLDFLLEPERYELQGGRPVLLARPARLRSPRRRRTDRRLPARRGRGPGATPQGRQRAARTERLAARRRGQRRHRLHRQGRGRPEHPHLAHARSSPRNCACRRWADPPRHGRHGAVPLRRRHRRQPHDAGDGLATPPRRRRRARTAARPGRRRSRKLKREALTVNDGKIEGPRGKPSFTFGQLSKGKKLVKVIDDKAPTTAGGEVDRRRHVGGEGGRPGVRDRLAQVHLRREAAEDALRRGAAAAELRGEAGRREDGQGRVDGRASWWRSRATSSAWRLRPSRRPGRRSAAIEAEWKESDVADLQR